MCVCVCAQACGDQRLASGVSHQVPCSLGLSLLAWRLAGRLDWLASESQEATCPCLLGASIAKCATCLAFIQALGVELRFSTYYAISCNMCTSTHAKTYNTYLHMIYTHTHT